MEDDWRTPEIREAEAQLEDALANAERRLAEADRFEAEQETDSRGLGREQIEEIERLVRAGKAPPEVAALQRLVDSGELSWDDISQGRNLEHEAVQRAFSASVPAMTRVKELADEGHDLPTILGADPNSPNQSDPYGDDTDPPDSYMQSGKW